MCAVAVIENVPLDEAFEQAVSGRLLAGKRALVTGGSRGIGKATALALAEAGAAVAINYQHSVEAADEVCRAVGKLDVQTNAYQADVACEDEAKAMIDAVTKDFGAIDILVNNAGITRDKSFLKMTKIMWDEVMGVNLNGVFHVTRLRPAGHGRGGLGPHHQHDFDRGANRQLRAGQLCRLQGRADCLHDDLGPRSGPQGRDRQCRRPRIHRNGHDQGHDPRGVVGR